MVGLLTGTDPAVVIPRAVKAMIGGVLLGLVAGWLGLLIVRDGISRHEEASDSDETAAQAAADGDGAAVGM